MRSHLLLALPLLAGPLVAQQRPIVPAASVLFAPAAGVGRAEPTPGQEEARRGSGGVGALIGGALGAGMVLFAYSQGGHGKICDASIPETCSGGNGLDGASMVIGTVGGAALGFLVDRSLRRPRPASPHPIVSIPRDTLPPDTGLKWWQGSLLGAGLGGLGLVTAAKVMRWDEQSEISAYAFAPLGAIVGLVVGGSLAQAH